MNQYCKIRSIWSGRQETPATVGRKLLQTLDALSPIDPIFSNWHIIDGRAQTAIPIDDARSRIAAVVENNVSIDDFEEPYPDDGYHALGTNNPRITPRSMGFGIIAGAIYKSTAELTPGYVNIPPDPSIVTYPIFKSALLTILSIWPSATAMAYLLEDPSEGVPIVPGVPVRPWGIRSPWLGYLSESNAAGLASPAELGAERTPDGGLLLIAAEDRLDSANPDHLRRSKILSDILIERVGDLL